MSDINKQYVDLSGLSVFKSEVSDLIDNKISAIDDFTGATSSSDGVAGHVPAPNAGDQNKFLCGDGDFHDVAFIGTQEEWNALTSSQKAEYSNRIVNITDDANTVTISASNETAVAGLQCYKSGVVKQITFAGCTAASIPDGFRPTTNKYLGVAFDDDSKAFVLIFAGNDGTITVQAMGTASILSTYTLYGTFTYMY